MSSNRSSPRWMPNRYFLLPSGDCCCGRPTTIIIPSAMCCSTPCRSCFARGNRPARRRSGTGSLPNRARLSISTASNAPRNSSRLWPHCVRGGSGVTRLRSWSLTMRRCRLCAGKDFASWQAKRPPSPTGEPTLLYPASGCASTPSRPRPSGRFTAHRIGFQPGCWRGLPAPGKRKFTSACWKTCWRKADRRW